MGTARCSEDEFIALYREHGASGVAKALQIDRRKVYERKKRIEQSREIILKQGGSVSDDHPAIRSIQIANGCVIVGNDAHYRPGDPPTMHRAMVKLIKKLRPFAVVANGDMADFPSISRHPSIGWEKNPTVKQEIEVVQDRMDELKRAHDGALHIWNLGNHDGRMESRIAAVAPQFRGVHGVHLNDHFPGWQSAWALEINAGTDSWTEIRHREKSGVHASYNNTKEAGVTVVTGHDHRADVVTYNDRRGRRFGFRTGMMADSPLDSQFVNYLEARRVNWQSAFGVLTYRDGELLYPELCLRVRDGLVEFRGERFLV